MGGSSLIINKGSNIAQDLYNYGISSALLPGKRIYRPSFAELSDADIVDKLKRDPVIAQIIMYRKHLVAGRSWNIESASKDDSDKRIAAITEDGIKQIERFNSAMFNLAEAVFRGGANAYIEGERRLMVLGNDTQERNWWIPLRIKDVGIERFRQWAESDGNIVWELWSIKRYAWERLEHPEWFIKHIYEDTERTLGYGRGLIEAMYIYAYAKQTVLEKGLAGIDRWASGIIEMAIDTSKPTEPATTTKQILTNALNTLNIMRTEHAIVHDKADELKSIVGGMEGGEMVMKFLSYLDNSLRTLVLSANLPTSADKGGSFALAEIQSDSTEATVQFDRTLLAEDLTRDLIGLFHRLNYQNFVDMGLDKAKKPKFKIVQEKKSDPEKRATIIVQALSQGITLRKDEVYEQLGFSMPQEDDEVIEKPEQLPFGNPVNPTEE